MRAAGQRRPAGEGRPADRRDGRSGAARDSVAFEIRYNGQTGRSAGVPAEAVVGIAFTETADPRPGATRRAFTGALSCGLQATPVHPLQRQAGRPADPFCRSAGQVHQQARMPPDLIRRRKPGWRYDDNLVAMTARRRHRLLPLPSRAACCWPWCQPRSPAFRPSRRSAGEPARPVLFQRWPGGVPSCRAGWRAMPATRAAGARRRLRLLPVAGGPCASGGGPAGAARQPLPPGPPRCAITVAAATPPDRMGPARAAGVERG